MALKNFRTPQQVTDESVDRFLKSSYNITNAIARSGTQIINDVAKQKSDQQKRNDERDLQMQQMFDKANEFGSTGDAKLDENILAFWNQKVDDYFTIKNGMQTGKIGKQEGNLALARINGMVGQFKAQTKYLAEQVAMYREDMANGIVSSTSSQQTQNILGAMAKGGNVQLTEKGGIIYYYLPGEDGVVPNDGNLLNGQQLIANESTDTNLYDTIPDYTSVEQAAYNNTIKPNDINSDYISLETINKGGYKFSYATFNEDKRATAAEDMVNNGSFRSAIQNDKKMKSYYQDVIDDEFLLANGLAEQVPDGKGGTKIVHGSWHEYDDDLSQEENDEIHQKQNKVAQLYMANQAMDKFSIPPGGQKFFSKEKITTDKDTKDDTVDAKFTTQAGEKYPAVTQKEFFGKLKAKEDIERELANLADEDMTEEFVSDLFLNPKFSRDEKYKLSKLMTANPEYDNDPKNEPKYIVDPSLNIVFDGNGTLSDVKNAIYEALGLDAEFDVMQSDYERYKSNTSGDKPKAYNF